MTCTTSTSTIPASAAAESRRLHALGRVLERAAVLAHGCAGIAAVGGRYEAQYAMVVELVFDALRMPGRACVECRTEQAELEEEATASARPA